MKCKYQHRRLQDGKDYLVVIISKEIAEDQCSSLWGTNESTTPT